MDWSNFFSSAASASATLTGLIFVGVSINLKRILELRGVPERALISLTLLMVILILSILFLVPGQSPHARGAEVLGSALLAWGVISRTDIRTMLDKTLTYRFYHSLNAVLNQVALLPYFIGGITLLREADPGGTTALYWIVGAFVFSFIKAVMDAWVLLIEINR